MAPVDKAKAAGVSASSFFDLKAELAKQEETFVKNKLAGKANVIIGGVKRPDKKPTVWARQNKGIKARAKRDIELEEISKSTVESARAALERKAKIYDKLRKGKSGGLNEQQYEALLVDFDSKPVSEFFESDSDDVDESLTVPQEPLDDDPVIEYEDEFGRIRTARRSEVPRHLLPSTEKANVDVDDDLVIHNPVNHFPVYEPDEERIAEIEKAYSDAANPLNIHYDSTREVRAKGAGFYQFSGDEGTRKTQMEELKAAREETEKTRQETGAMDVRPGEIEGMRAEDDVASTKSRAMEKRKRELEERRKLLDAKRRKTKGAEEPISTPSVQGTRVEFAEPQKPATAQTDPFAALETKTADKGKKRAKATKAISEADVFLAQLEQDMMGGK